ncbi:MAG: glucose-1-phosphate thymidylyltransferase [Patescibacteria group bacterium]|nr:glucose-1-phosphate thymidylyltransferase [Patescibacteria group bacterium]
MKALITAGGHGTRLRPITYTTNKHLVPIANKPMIYYALEKVADTGIKEVGIVINAGDVIFPKKVGDGSKWGLKIKYIEQPGGPLGLAHVVKIAEDFIGKDSFVFYLGDNIILNDIKPFVDKFEKEKLNCLLALSKVKDPQRFGVPEIINRRIVKIEEKPQNPKSNFAVTGIYVYDYHIFEAVNAIKPSARGELEISDAHQYLLDHNYTVGFSEITGWWKDTGKLLDLLEGNQLVLNYTETEIDGEIEERVSIQGKVKIGKGTKIVGNSVIRGPIVIGENCVIKDSYIGPFTSIGNRVEIYGAEIENSIIFEDADINCNKRITDSLIGVNATITPVHETLPSGHKLLVGDNSFIEL